METMRITRGSRVVIASRNDATARWESRLYVNGGDTATATAAKHKTTFGALRWAKRLLGGEAETFTIDRPGCVAPADIPY